MRQPRCSRGAGAEFSRRRLKLATLHLVFLQFVVMAFRGREGSQVISVIATRCWLKQRRTQIPYMAGSVYRPLAVCQASILLKRGERSSPGELIHPGDLARSASGTKQRGRIRFAIALMAIKKEASETRGGGDSLRRDNGRVTAADAD